MEVAKISFTRDGITLGHRHRLGARFRTSSVLWVPGIRMGSRVSGQAMEQCAGDGTSEPASQETGRACQREQPEGTEVRQGYAAMEDRASVC